VYQFEAKKIKVDFSSKSKILNVHDFFTSKCTVRQYAAMLRQLHADHASAHEQLMNSSQLTVVLQL
jgi:hypothetical protein